MSLNRRQIAWLRLPAADPAPHRWAWVDRYGSRRPPMSEKNYLRAWRIGPYKIGGAKVQQATIHQDDRAGLEPFMNSLAINDAGRALLETLK
ncbi:hypothetical protein E4M02_02465 [Brevundimonas sp. S30B]|uniref:hypothetical protein n=1 Tax=unclassified Brevundimonas TaxID=2622653 RepID=UPI001072B924|nr:MULTISPECIES: hypothetical protein [unclassified Brevundimonas]QBX37246.1 hypothetical protein E4M01_05355 [Brevundimonas sp. MF30-B]TFW03961.1 hypothetical protein E4M02_02465 [Brevundimonas sp. S30B]